MNRVARFSFFIVLFCCAPWARASDFTLSPWQTSASYGVTTDFMERESPRAYAQDLLLGLQYQWTDTWSLAGSLAGKFVTYDGEIEKGQEQSYAETINPTARISASHITPFAERHTWRQFFGNVFLLDESSRREGYLALPYLGTQVSL